MTARIRGAGYTAAACAIGLSVAHGAVYTIGFLTEADATWAAYLVGGLAPSAVAAGLGASALVLTRGRPRRGERLLIGLAWLACLLFTLQAVLLLMAGDPRLFAPDRPGTYSLVGGPAFGVVAWASLRRRTAWRRRGSGR